MCLWIVCHPANARLASSVRRELAQQDPEQVVGQIATPSASAHSSWGTPIVHLIGERSIPTGHLGHTPVFLN